METDTVINIIDDLKVFIYGGIQTLPLTLGGTLLVIGLFTANYPILFFLAGYLVLTPLTAWGSNKILSLFLKLLPINLEVFSSDVCKIYKPSEASTATESSVTSEWYAMICFFIGYMINNALYLYNREGSDISNNISTDTNKSINLDNKIMNRKSHALMSIVTSIVILGIVTYFRFKTGCENKIGIFITLAMFGTAGYYWYVLLSSVMDNRLSDLFGIANRLLPPVALDNRPVACVPYSG
jgi:hypothetical protein